MAVDASGRVYVAWPERGHSIERPQPQTGDARIVIASSTNGSAWTAPRPIRADGLGHQVMPALTFYGGRLVMIFYDLREDVSQLFGPFVDDLPIIESPGASARHTMDVFVASALPGPAPVFTSVRLSDYASGYLPGSEVVNRLQFNPPNLPLFRQGNVPFMGDYIDLAPAPVFVQRPDGVWTYNLTPAAGTTAHGFWTDNRDVRAPQDGNWSNYTPVTSDAVGLKSRFDPTQLIAPCVVGQTGMRNQNLYTGRVTDGLFLAALGNSKPLGTIQRAFVLTAENASAELRTYRFTIVNQPVAGEASFLQFSGQSPLTVLDVSIAPQSTVARSVFVTAAQESARVEVAVTQVAGGTPVPGGPAGSVVLNGDPTAPRIQNPRIQNPRIQNPVQLAEEYNPSITTAFLASPAQAPRIQNPRIQNPLPEAPRIQNDSTQAPRIQNDSVSNPDIVSPRIQNPNAESAVVESSSLQNPRIQNVDLTNAAINDTTWVLTNDGNTTASYTINLVTNAPLPVDFASQLLIHKTHTSPTAMNCVLAEQPYTLLVANIPDPEFVPVSEIGNPRIQNPRIQNTTIGLGPGESANVTLRIVDPDRFDAITFDAGAAVAPAAVAQAVNTEDAAAGITQPTIAVPLTITTSKLAAAMPGAQYTVALQRFAGTGQTFWTVNSGALPPGLTLDPATGVISGMPTTPGNYVFTVQSTDTAGNSDTQTLTLQINPDVPAGFDRVWNGVDSDWSNPLNWSPTGVPPATDRVYISAAISPMPRLTRDTSVLDLVLQDGATLDTNGFVLTVGGRVWAGNTIVGTGQTVVIGQAATVSGTFSNLTIAGRASLAGPVLVTGNLTLLPGAQLNLNGQPATIAQALITDAPGAAPRITGSGGTLLATGVSVNGLLLDRLDLTLGGGALTRFDNVIFTGYLPTDVQLKVNHPGAAGPITFNNLSFFTVPTTGRFLQATDILSDAQILIINLVNPVTADGSALTAALGGAVVNWIAAPGTANLAVSQSATPINPAIAGAPLTFTVVVRNGGPLSATGVTLAWTPSAGTTVTQASPAQGTCTIGATVSCALGSLSPDTGTAITIVVTTPVVPIFTATASVTGAGSDPVVANNSTQLSTGVVSAGALADLSVTQSDSADPVIPGSAYTYTITVSNSGPSTAPNVLVLDDVPSGITIGSVTSTQGACTVTPTQILCGLGNLDAGQSATVTLNATATLAGLVTNVVTVSSSSPDGNPSNNVAMEQTMVAVTAGCGAPTFAGPDVYGGSPAAVSEITLADMNHDGRPDIVTTYHDPGNGVAVQLNQGSGVFTGTQLEPALFTSFGEPAFVAAVADFNGDTHPDVVVGVGGEPHTLMRLLLGDGTGNLTVTPFSVPVGNGFLAEAADLDGDGDQDVLAQSTTNELILLRNDGSGGFAAPVTLLAGPIGDSAVIDDFNGDSRPDIAVAMVGSQIAVLRADGAGGYLSPLITATASPAKVNKTGDLNHDGRADLATTEGSSFNGTGVLSVLLGDGNGGFGPAAAIGQGQTAVAPAFADVNGDTHIDLVAAHPLISSVSVHLGNGTGGFGPAAHFATPAFSNAALADVNGDGRPDFVVGAITGQVRVFFNTCGQPSTDLGLTIDESADPVLEGAEFDYTVTITNHGATEATDVRVVNVTSTGASAGRPPNAQFVSVVPSAGTVSTTVSGGATLGVHAWTLPSLAPQGVATLQIRIRPLGGAVAVTASVTSAAADTNPANNTEFESTQVTPTGRTIVVTSAADSGPGTLRQAILESDADTGDVDRIHFSLPAPASITLTSSLPTISQPVVIDGATQPGYAGTPIVELNGNNVAGTGLSITGGGSTVRGLVINRFTGSGISISTQGGNVVEANIIGADVAGTAARPNGGRGILVTSSANRIGSTAPGGGNLVSGNGSTGIQLSGAGATGNQVIGNTVGTNVSGTGPLPNGNAGVQVLGGANNTVGGPTPAHRNLISGGAINGMSIRSGATGNLVQGNFIGTNATGTAAVPNMNCGVFIGESSTNVIADNLVSGNGTCGGVVISATQAAPNVANGNIVRGNRIGTDVTGTLAIPNASTGIVVTEGATATVIGGAAAGAGNVISGNASGGVYLDNTTSGNIIEGNLIGTDVTGALGLGNGGTMPGVQVNGANNRIGGTTASQRNVISAGGARSGINLSSTASGNVVQGNYVGTTAAGSAALPNSTGIVVSGGAVGTQIGGSIAGGAGNLISGNGSGIFVSAGAIGSTIYGNLIGTSAGGTAALPNTNGLLIESTLTTAIGGASADTRNVISGNSGRGIYLRAAAQVQIVGNFIGLNAAGTAAIGNGAGVYIENSPNNVVGGASATTRNVISGNQSGVTISGSTASGNVVQGNYIGTNAAGTAAIPNTGIQSGVFILNAPNNTIGGPATGTGNVVSGNTLHAVTIVGATATGNLVQGNFIGTAANGTTPLGNGANGVDIVSAGNNTIGGPATARNVIANNQSGIQIRTNATGNNVQNNLIASNSGHGVRVDDTSGNTIGGAVPGLGNIIQNNGTGIVLLTATSARNSFLGNSIFGSTFLGIDIDSDGVTVNDAGDADSGPNGRQNFPVITSAAAGGGGITIQGTLNSTPSTQFYIELFANATCDSSGNGEGQTLLGSTSTTTSAGGTGAFSLIVGSASGFVTATATDPIGNTSEFSTCVAVTAGGPQNFVVTNTNNSGPGSFRQAILDANANIGITDTIAFNIPGAGPRTITLASNLPAISDTVLIDGTTQPGFAGTPLIEISGNNVAGNGLTVSGSPTTIRSLVINRFIGAGIVLNVPDNNIEGNYIGIDPTGTIARSNSGAGVVVNASAIRVGGTTAAQRNVISGSTNASGITVSSVNQVNILGNYIGVNAAGTAAIPNQFDGIRLTNSTGVQIGGTATGAGNLISGNVLAGIRILGAGSTGNRVEGNRIGTHVDGVSPVANGEGVVISGGTNNVIGGTDAGAGNLVDRNTGNGVTIAESTATGNLVQNNFIGNNFGNGGDGVQILNDASGNTIGGTGTNQGNQIVSNERGVNVVSGTRNRISSNNIYSDGQNIDLGNDGPTANDAGDADTGANNRQNYPIINSAVDNGSGAATASVTLNSTPNTTFRIEFFGSNFCPGGVLNSTTVTTNAAGTVTFTTSVFTTSSPFTAITSSSFITATATDPNGNTSEQGPCFDVQPRSADLTATLVDGPDPVLPGGTVTYQATVVNNGPQPADNAVATFSFPVSASLLATEGCPGTPTIGAGTVSCPLSSLAPGAQVFPRIRLSPATAGSLTVTFSVSSVIGDPQPGNNTAFATTTIAVAGATYTVTNTADSGAGSLRQAILNANTTSNTFDTINFNIPGAGPHTIAPLSFLPTVTGPVVIDGTTQPGYAGTPIVELSGVSAGSTSNGLWLTGGSTIRGLAINRFGASAFGGAALVLAGAGNVVERNYLGTNVAGTAAAQNFNDGIWMGGPFNRIGGVGAGNVISGNGRYGVFLVDARYVVEHHRSQHHRRWRERHVRCAQSRGGRAHLRWQRQHAWRHGRRRRQHHRVQRHQHGRRRRANRDGRAQCHPFESSSLEYRPRHRSGAGRHHGQRCPRC